MYPTPYPDVNVVLDLLLAKVKEVLQQEFIGMYLYGSLASGDFNPDSSDIDFIVVSYREVSNDLISALEEMHTEINDSGLKWAKKLEGTYISKHALRRYNSDDGLRPSINEGRFAMEHHDSDWVIQRYILREYGVVVVGPDPKMLIDPVTSNDLRQAIKAVLNEWWSPLLTKQPRLESAEYQVFAVLTMCRALYTLRNGDIASKPVSAQWAMNFLGGKQAELIQQALQWRSNMVFNRLGDVTEFITYTVKTSNSLK